MAGSFSCCLTNAYSGQCTFDATAPGGILCGTVPNAIHTPNAPLCRNAITGETYSGCQWPPAQFCWIDNATNTPFTPVFGFTCPFATEYTNECICRNTVNQATAHCQLIPWEVSQLPPFIGTCGVCAGDDGCCLKNSCAKMQSPSSCSYLGGTWTSTDGGTCCLQDGCRNINPNVCEYFNGGRLFRLCTSVNDQACVGTGCCLCNRFCTLPEATCTAIGGVSGVTQASCAASNRKPACRKGYWKRGIRPSQHRTGMTRPIGNGVALHSKQPTKDTTATNECRVAYGWQQRHATKGMMHGAICNTFNRGCPTQSRTTRKLKLVRHPTRGIMRMEGKYRRPCPEATEMGCTTTVNCTT